MDRMDFALPEMDFFIRSAFQKKPFVFESVTGHQLVGWGEINNLLEKDILDYPRIRLANDGIPSERGFKGFVTYTLTVTGETSPHINRYNLLKRLQTGSTLIIDRCQAFFERAQQAASYLSTHLRCRSGANLYCAWSSTPSFGAHFDNHDVIAVQIEGVKRWEVYAPTRPYPLLNDKSFDQTPPAGEPMLCHTLTPGQAIYVPAGYWHNVFTETERSMHISFPVVRPRKIDLIRMVLERLEASAELREPIAHGSDAIGNARLSGVLYACLANIDFDEWEAAVVEDCMQGRDIKFNLPDIRTRDA